MPQDLPTLGRFHLSPGVPTSLSSHVESVSAPKGEPPGPRKYKEVLQLIGERTGVCLSTLFWPQTMILVLCSPLPRTPAALQSLCPSLRLSEAEESFPTRPKGYSTDYDGQSHCHQGMFIVLSANKCKVNKVTTEWDEHCEGRKPDSMVENKVMENVISGICPFGLL